MKITLVFDPYEDQDELYAALHGTDFRTVLREFDQWLRGLIKYGDKPRREEIILESIRSDLLRRLTAKDLVL